MRVLVVAALLALLAACHPPPPAGPCDAPAAACSRDLRGRPVDTTKEIYRDDEAPAFQIHITNGVETKAPWSAVPEGERWLLDEDDPLRPNPKRRVPIARVITVSVDKEGKPAPAEQAWYYQATREGLNPAHSSCSLGGKAH